MAYFESNADTDEQAEKICCGDTKHCSACTLFKMKDDVNADAIKTFTLNAMDRCDFYRGPGEVTFHP